jgi:two-component system chemotaxis response regulator CheB
MREGQLDVIEGARTVVRHQGQMIAQDEASSAVWGMPAAVVNEDLADFILPLKEIAPAILELVTAQIG